VKLFDDKPREHLAPSENSEHPFEYTNRSARPEAAKVREFLERAFSHCPADRQEQLVARMRSDEHLSCSFELILLELLRLRGLRFTVEAPKAGTAKRPDFLVESSSGSFYLEAIVADEQTPERVAERKRLGQLVDLVNRMQSDNFFVGFEVEVVGPGQPSAKAIKDYLSTKLEHLDPDDESIWIGDDGRVRSPEWVWEDAGWRIVFLPTPKKVEARGRSGRRPVGSIYDGARPVYPDDAIRRAVRAKATRYGEMDRPYVVAVNVLAWPLDDIDIVDGLFGTLVLVDVPGRGLVRVRERDGALQPDRNTRVSAVALFDEIDPWSAAKRKAVLVHNPFAKRPLPPGVLGIADGRYVVGREDLAREGGAPLAELLGLPPDWPSD
jgi:hypothetical protein